MSRDNLIVAQCCFKGAIDLAVANKITVDEIPELTTQLTKHIINNFGGGTSAVVPAKPVFKPKENYAKANNNSTPKIANPSEDASEKQIGFIKSLISELPLSEQDAYKQLIAGKVNKGTASGLINQLKEKIDENEPVAKTNTAPEEAPF
tara:strand:- start:8169 stop:8615 length:447 start_codon:yes stop_codon:yes gene_type:complete